MQHSEFTGHLKREQCAEKKDQRSDERSNEEKPEG
jgi:hypothetical protein